MAARHLRIAHRVAAVLVAALIMLLAGGPAMAANPAPGGYCVACLDIGPAFGRAAVATEAAAGSFSPETSATVEPEEAEPGALDELYELIQSIAAWTALGMVLFLAIVWYYRLRAAVFRTRGPLRVFDLIPLLSPRVAIEPFDVGLTGEERGEAFASRIRYEMKYLDASTDLASLFLSAGTDAAANLTSDLEKFGEESKLAAAALSLVQRLLPREQWNASGSLGAVPRPNATALLRRGSHVVAGLTLELPAPGTSGRDATIESESDYRAVARGVAAWIAHHMSDHLGAAQPRPWLRLVAATGLDVLILGSAGAIVAGPVGAGAGALAALALSIAAETRSRGIKSARVKTTVYYRAASAAFLHTGIAFSEGSRATRDERLRSRLRSDAVFMYQRAHQTDLTNLTAAYSIGYEKLRTPEDNAEAGRIFKHVIAATSKNTKLETHPYEHLRDQALYNFYVVRLHVIRQMLRDGVRSADVSEIKHGLEEAEQCLAEAIKRANDFVSPMGTWERLKNGPGYDGALQFAERTLPILKTAAADLAATKLSVRVHADTTGSTRESHLWVMDRYKELGEKYCSLKGELEALARRGLEVHMAYYNLACRNATLFGMFNDDPFGLPTGVDDKQVDATVAHLRREATETLRRAFVEATEFRARLARWAVKDPCLDPIREAAPAGDEAEYEFLRLHSTFEDWISAEADGRG